MIAQILFDKPSTGGTGCCHGFERKHNGKHYVKDIIEHHVVLQLND